ncbi:GPW/gp25 family protein [Candidatus Chloroploca asiatica]|uniref:Baseplate assembly protein n=1 Tax=Candidatus Chloroploca asiatica TaxID=1506545 RepID=A0A2H3KJ30_9CHLR|nr:GPW/gp25 family protein [Candidatus Chloroploca asiatica]PDV97888.1 baseplate assembly protein [Candidatus Chloroploca asiatica]
MIQEPISWPLLAVPDANGQLHYPTLDESVRQSIQIILRTRPGERLQRQEFGGGLQVFLHQPNTLTTHRRIHDTIVQALERWETRIKVERVEIKEVPERPTWIRVEVMYRLRRTGVIRQLGLSMELGG